MSGSAAANAYVYYTFVATNMTAPYVITLTTLSGDPDIYVANGNITAPGQGQGNSMWYSNGIGNESVTLDPQDPNVRSCALPCRYYIGVRAFGRPASFQLLVSRANSGLLPLLIDGQPQRGHLVPGVLTLFRFVMSSFADDIQFLVTPIYGTVMVSSRHCRRLSPCWIALSVVVLVVRRCWSSALVMSPSCCEHRSRASVLLLLADQRLLVPLFCRCSSTTARTQTVGPFHPPRTAPARRAL